MGSEDTRFAAVQKTPWALYGTTVSLSTVQLYQFSVGELFLFVSTQFSQSRFRNYEPNKQLSFWVATQRKYYNLKMKGKPSYLTDERQKQLDDMDFVWSYWDYNFEQKGF